MTKRIEYTPGQMVGELEFVQDVNDYILVSKRTGKEQKFRQAKFKCNCGNVFVSLIGNVRKGGTTRCFSCSRTSAIKNRTRHGGCSIKKSKQYGVWSTMKDRCNNPQNSRFIDYGGRGICVVDFWDNSFENFMIWWQLQDLCNEPNISIDRIDNSLGYSPDNCRLATAKEQARNRRSNVWMTNGVETLCMLDVAKKLGIEKSTIQYHIKRYGKTKSYKGWRLI